jgi:competence protein ComEC
VTDSSGESRALGPLWGLTLGGAAGSGLALSLPMESPGWLELLLIVAGASLFAVATRRGTGAPVLLWLLAGVTLVGGHGLHVAGVRHEIAAIMDREDPVWVRARMVVTEGWTEGRWGWRTRVRVLESRHDHLAIPKLQRCRLEIRGGADQAGLPRSGEIVRGLVSIRGSPRSPLLVASSRRLIETTTEARPLPSLRGRLAGELLAAARTDVNRIRAAELAAALSLGRRDLLSPARRDGWRRSGLAHLLAVSGLHVGLVAGMTWLLLAVCGASPTTTRIAILVVLPTYAILAGASPSAVRAAMMGSIFVGAGLLGRAILPMAAVLLTAFLLLLVDPSLVVEVSFQLTVLLTAALVRWAPRLTAAIPFPRWFAAAIAVPIVAQLAAAPLVAHHFGSAIPGAAASNLLVPWLLAPVVLASVAATAVAPVWSTAAGWLLEVVDLGSKALWIAGAPGRSAELIPPPIPPILLASIVVLGLLSLLPGRRARIGVIAYTATIAAFALWWRVIPPPKSTEVELLPISAGLALRAGSEGAHLVMDGGSRRREAAQLLAPSRLHHLEAVIASHGDEDHITGLVTIIRTTTVDKLIIPIWMRSSPKAVPLIRTARRRGVQVVPVARGSRIDLGSMALEILWPPATDAPSVENERSMVARLRMARGSILLTADIGRITERRLVESTNLVCSVVIVPHHGSRNSATPVFLDAAGARLALISAGPENLHHHPHPEVIERLERKGIEYRMPIRDGRCGARLENGEWVLYPKHSK